MYSSNPHETNYDYFKTLPKILRFTEENQDGGNEGPRISRHDIVLS